MRDESTQPAIAPDQGDHGAGHNAEAGRHTADIRDAIASVERLLQNPRNTPQQEAALRLMLNEMKSNAVKKLVLFLSAIPIAVLTNAIRIVLLSVICEVYGSGAISELIHQVLGLLVFALAFLLLYMVEKCLS